MPINFYSPEYFVFNNFSAHAVEFKGELYPTSEHLYQSLKLTDENARDTVRLARSPSEAKRLANTEFKHHQVSELEKVAPEIMEKVLRLKFEQHEEVREKLRASGSEDIIEDSPTDYFWGEGADGSGQNMLGKLWMKLRAELV